MLCPHCGAGIGSLNIKAVEAAIPFETTRWKTIVFGCPTCQKVVAAQMDPIALKADTVREAAAAIRKP